MRKAPEKAYIAAWKFCSGTGAGGRGGVAAENQPVTDCAARYGIPATAVVAPHNLPRTVGLLAAAACGCAGIGTMDSGAGTLAI